MEEDSLAAALSPGPGTDRQGSSEFRALLRAVEDGVLELDPAGHVGAADDDFLAQTGLAREAVAGRPVDQLFADGTGTRVASAVRALVETDLETTTVDVRLAAGAGDDAPRRARLRASAVRDGSGVRSVLAVVREVEGQTGPHDASTVHDATTASERLATNTRTIERLYGISADRDRSLGEKVEALLALGCERLDLPVGFLAEVDPESDEFEVLHASGDHDQIRPGETAPLSETYCQRTIGGDGLLAVEDAPAAGWEGDRAYEAWEFDCYIGGRVEVDDELYGTLCFVAHPSRPEPFSAFERTFVELATQWIGYEIERESHQRDLERYRAYTDDVLDAVDDHLYVVDERGYLERWNRSVAEVTGYTDDEIETMHGTEFFPEDHREYVASKIAEAFETGSARMETEIETRDGERIPYEYAAARLEDPEGDPVIAGIGRDVTEREERERRLESQRERLQALNGLHEVVRDITEAVVERSTREEIEDAVCRGLADTDSYAFAWIGEVDPAAERVVPRTGAGTAGYPDDVEISIDPDEPNGRGPTGRAVRSGEVETTADVLEDPDYEPWRAVAREHGFRSSAAVPIEHDGAVFGVLNVYADRPGAFADEERRVLAQLGEVVGHAIASVERKRVIMGDEVVELEVRVPDVVEYLGLPTVGGRVTFDRAVPLGDGDHLLYGTVSGEAASVIEDAPAVVEHWESLTVEDPDADETSFEVRMSASPIVGAVATHGGAVETAVVEDGDLHLTVLLPTGADVRSIVEVLEERYPKVEPLARRQLERGDEPTRLATLTLLEELTDRQRAALETAFFGGFYEWPREHSGEELAEQLDITPATFTQHLRAAERKLLEAVFEEVPASG